MAVTNGWGQAAKNNTNGYGKLATNNIGAGSVYEDSWAGDTAIIGVTAGFSYSKSSYVNDEADPTPTITGTTGGTFSAGSGLVFVDSGSNTGSSTGQIDLSATTVAAYTITYTVSGVSSNVSLSVTQAFINDYSMLFDGTNDYIDLGDNDFGLAYNQPLSISVWVNIGTAGTDCIISKRESSGAYKGWSLRVNSTGEFMFLFSENGFSKYINTTSTTQLSTSTWYHLVVTYDGSVTTGGFKLYLNGVAETVSSASAGTVTTFANSTVASIGARGAANLFFDGKIDEVAIWSSELGATAVTELYNSGTPIALDSDKGNYTSSADLLAWYRMGD